MYGYVGKYISREECSPASVWLATRTGLGGHHQIDYCTTQCVWVSGRWCGKKWKVLERGAHIGLVYLCIWHYLFSSFVLICWSGIKYGLCLGRSIGKHISLGSRHTQLSLFFFKTVLFLWCVTYIVSRSVYTHAYMYGKLTLLSTPLSIPVVWQRCSRVLSIPWSLLRRT